MRALKRQQRRWSRPCGKQFYVKVRNRSLSEIKPQQRVKKGNVTPQQLQPRVSQSVTGWRKKKRIDPEQGKKTLRKDLSRRLLRDTTGREF
jgi:hypothetical protein